MALSIQQVTVDIDTQVPKDFLDFEVPIQDISTETMTKVKTDNRSDPYTVATYYFEAASWQDNACIRQYLSVPPSQLGASAVGR